MDRTSMADRQRARVEDLCADTREPGTRGHQRACESIAAEFARLGFETTVERAKIDGERCANVLARSGAADGPFVVFGAHYDTQPGTPGADDNASAVAALLEIARHVAERPAPGRGRLVLAAYDLEEYGFGGSRLHARSLRQREHEVEIMASLEMLGFTSPAQGLPDFLAGRRSVGDFIGLCSSEASAGPLEAIEEAFRSDPDLPVETLLLPGTGRGFPIARLSDHSSFWDAGFPALMVTDTSFLRNPHYHLSSDRPETLDYPFLARVTAALARSVDRLLGVA